MKDGQGENYNKKRNKNTKFNNVYKKIISCFILSYMLVGYILPVHALNGLAEVEKVKYYGDYKKINSRNFDVMERVKKEIGLDYDTDIFYNYIDKDYKKDYSNKYIFFKYSKENKVGIIIKDSDKEVYRMNVPDRVIKFQIEKSNGFLDLGSLNFETEYDFPLFKELPCNINVDLHDSTMTWADLNQASIRKLSAECEIHMKDAKVTVKNVKEILDSDLWKSGRLKGIFDIYDENGNYITSSDKIEANAQIRVDYKDNDGNIISNEKYYNGYINDSVTIYPKQIDGYTCVSPARYMTFTKEYEQITLVNVIYLAGLTHV